MKATTRRSDAGIGLTPVQWIWLLGNLVWLHTIVPGIILAVAAYSNGPEAGVLERIGAALALIVGVPFVLVVGFGAVTWATLARVAAGFRRNEATT